MTNITIVADIVAKDDQMEFVKSELLKLAKITPSEEGCIQYDLQQDDENSSHFIMFEVWENMALLEKHSNHTPLKEFKQKTENSLVSFTACKMTHLVAV